MAVILKNKYYLYSLSELISGILDVRGKMGKRIDISFRREDDFLSFCVEIFGKIEKFYIKRQSLNKYELQAIYKETFLNWMFNGHCYIKPRMEVRQGDVVIDAGGCEGFYSRYALENGASKVIIFEPCRELAEGLEKTFKDEVSAGKVLIVEKALGRKKYKDNLYINKNMICASSVVMEEGMCFKQEIEVITLDEALENLGIDHIDVIKMDIEGTEVDAVIGARRTIKRCHPKMMIATYHGYYNAIKICRLYKNIYKCKMYGCYQFEIPYRPYMTFLY